MLRRLLLLLAPFFVIALTLILHQAMQQVPPVDWQDNPSPPPATDPPPPTQELRVVLIKPDGNPLPSGQVVLLEPELQSAQTNENGVALLHVRGKPPFHIYAWADGMHPILAAPFDSFRGGPFTLKTRESLATGRVSDLVETNFDFEILDLRGQPLFGAVLWALSSTDPQAAPFLGITNAQGQSKLVGVLPEFQEFEVFAPGLPPEPAWRLAQFKIAGTHRIPTVSFQATGMQPNSILYGTFVSKDASLPIVLADENGQAKLGPLPPGNYQFRNAGKILMVLAEEGNVSVLFD